MSLPQLQQMLNHESGLMALAGTADVRELLARHDPAAVLAIESSAIASGSTWVPTWRSWKGRDALVFTGGIGEGAPEIRRQVCEGFGWAGLTIDAERNRGHAPRISTDDSRMAVYVIPTDEERLIARETLRLMQGGT